ncbi:MAG: CpsD/CapB family tyrosine-protein kinase, partial [Acidimicrobiales bacterium]|nr:CpsD/CapB family tyrosine-protein kinase [Acidimicrobiales bacterium]
GPPDPPLASLEAAVGAPADDGWKLPGSRAGRGAILALVGLALGLAGALAADRLDTRIRGKADAERAFDLPVIAEIPPLGGTQRGRELLVATKPASPFVEAYRALRTVVLFAANEIVGEAHEADGPAEATSNGSGPHHAKVILVTSPAAGEGKTTTAAHLAAVLAEGDRRVLVISADFRRPRIHEYFDVPREPGLSDVLDPGAGRVRLSDLQMTTSFEQVHLLPSGRPVNNPAQLLTESTHLLRAARPLFDFIVVDTPPLLVANDATELAAVADLVVLVAKADRTSRDAARRATELLRRVDAPLLGVVVSAAHDTPTAYGYYRYRYYAEADQGSGGRRRRKDRSEPVPAAAMAGEASHAGQP